MAGTTEPPEHRACRMNGDPDHDERLRAEGRREAAGWIAEQIRAAYDQSGDRALLEALGYAVKYTGTAPERSVAASERPGGGPSGPKLSAGF